MNDELYNGLEAEITPDGDVAEGHEDAALTILGVWLKGDSGAEFHQKFGGDSGEANLKRMLANTGSACIAVKPFHNQND